jgi:hypothetical protein
VTFKKRSDLIPIINLFSCGTAANKRIPERDLIIADCVVRFNKIAVILETIFHFTQTFTRAGQAGKIVLADNSLSQSIFSNQQYPFLHQKIVLTNMARIQLNI